MTQLGSNVVVYVTYRLEVAVYDVFSVEQFEAVYKGVGKPADQA